MRSQRQGYRGWIGLIRKGSGCVSGIARLVDVGNSLSPGEMVATFDRHCIPESMIRSGEVAKWNIPWIFDDIRVLRRAVPYRHPNGAITLFSLDPSVSAAIIEQSDEPAPDSAPAGIGDNSPRHSSPLTEAREVTQKSISQLGSGTLLGETVLTAGNIRNNHFYLTHFLDRFPKSMIGGTSESFLAPRQAMVDWGGASDVETDIPSDKKMFRRRSWVGRFFADNDAEPGDTVLVHQTAPFRYKVSFRKKGDIL
jgi:hypothetical protein